MTGAVNSGDSTTVLVVDDDPEILNMLNIRLSNAGYRVVTASDGEIALQHAEHEKPRVVVLDVMMPKKTGWEVARALRQNEATRDIKILMLTAIGPQMNEMTAPLYGADAYIDKPFDFKKLEKAIADLLS
ncbi:MAG: response regulator [Proteobacteria bacterium]|nr:response regulator [Pseudomonadota bacterium]